VAIIGRDETVLDGAASSARADALLKSKKDMTALKDFIALLWLAFNNLAI
jgi:hypothetical protein